jgi:hypothetical protein
MHKEGDQMVRQFLFNRGQRGKRELSGIEYGPILDSALRHFRFLPKPDGNLFMALYGQRYKAQELEQECFNFALSNGVWAEKGNHLRLQLEEIQPESRLLEVHRFSLGLCRGKIGYVAQWDRVMTDLIQVSVDTAIKTRQRRVGDYERVLERIEDDLRSAFAKLLVQNSALVSALSLGDDVLEFVEVDPDGPYMSAYKNRV